MSLRSSCLALPALFILSFILSTFAEAVTPNNSGTYLLAYRTPAHQKYSTLDVFDDAVTQLNEYFKSRKVVFLSDPERGIVSTDKPMSNEGMLALARNAGANILLLVTVDRPKSQWIKITVQAMDLDGKVLWQDSASDMWGMTGKSGLKRTLTNLEAKLDPRIGGLGLPLASDEKTTVAAKAEVGHYSRAASECLAASPETPVTTSSQPIEVKLLLKKDTELPLALGETITNKKAYIGSMIGLALTDDISIQGYVVATKGSCAIGRITQGKEIKGMQPGTGLQFELLYLKAGKTKVPLAGEMTTAGHRDTGTIVASTVAFGLAGLLSTVNTAKTFEIPEGTAVTAYVAEDTTVYPLR